MSSTYDFDALYQRWIADESHDTQPSRADFVRIITFDLDSYSEAFEDRNPADVYYGGRARLSYDEACFISVSGFSD